MSSTADILRSGISAVGAGKEVSSDNIGGLAESSPSPATSQAEEATRAENSTVDDLFSGSEDAPTDSSEEGPASPEAKSKTSGDREVITITDENGRRRRVEIDYSDRASIKKAHEMMHGARKWQAERDRALNSAKETQSRLQQREKDWQALEQAFQQGEEHLFDVLKGRRGAFQEMVQKQIQRAEFLRRASPEEKKALEATERSEQQARELDRIRRENEEFKKQVTQERDTSEMRALESRVNPVFDKYRFSEKLGDPNDEHMFDEMLWNSALKRLEPYEEQGLDLTPELIDREFRNVASAIRKRIGVQADKKASRAIDQKKQEATENVQAKIKSGYRTGGAAKEASDLINSGNLTGLLKNWGKYGGLFNK